MEKTSEFLIYLMACSLQGTKPEEALLANIDMEALLRLAKAHSVSAMVCMALEQTDAFQHAAETTRLKWLDCKNKAVRKNMLLDAERHRLEKEFAEHGIWYMPLKGSILKDWYPKFGMREMADNDILFDPAGRKQVREIFQNRGYKTVSFRKGNHDVYEKAPIYNSEMHVSLFHGTYKELTEQYENVKERLLPVDGTVYQFKFGMGFLREANKLTVVPVQGMPGTTKEIGARYLIASVVVDQEPNALVDLLDLANKGENPRVTKTMLDSYIDSEEVDIDELMEKTKDFLSKANATKKAVKEILKEYEEQMAKKKAQEL